MATLHLNLSAAIDLYDQHKQDDSTTTSIGNRKRLKSAESVEVKRTVTFVFDEADNTLMFADQAEQDKIAELYKEYLEKKGELFRDGRSVEEINATGTKVLIAYWEKKDLDKLSAKQQEFLERVALPDDMANIIDSFKVITVAKPAELPSPAISPRSKIRLTLSRTTSGV